MAACRPGWEWVRDAHTHPPPEQKDICGFVSAHAWMELPAERKFAWKRSVCYWFHAGCRVRGRGVGECAYSDLRDGIF